MRNPAVFKVVAVIIILLITWRLTIYDVGEEARNIVGFDDKDEINPKFLKGTTTEPKCSLTRACPSDHFALRIRSGVANILGPRICFDGKIIMSYVMNNVGQGLNIVVVNGKNGTVEKFGYLNMIHGNREEILAYLKEIKPGMIVLLASFDDVTTIMTDDMREVFVGMGSTLIKSLKRRDSWVFAGRAGMESKSLFEKHAVNNDKTNIYEGWPDMVEMGGCIPRNPTNPIKYL